MLVAGDFGDIRSRHFRFLEEAARLGEVTVGVWPDDAVQALTGQAPRFPLAERLYLLNAVRYVHRAVPVEARPNPGAPPAIPAFHPDLWVDEPSAANPARLAACRRQGLDYTVLAAESLEGFPPPPPRPSVPGRKKVVVTGCYDWFHSGHIRFFEEVSAYGDLYAIVGHDANIRSLKGEGHPLLPQDERRYLVGSIKHVTEALISSGDGWLDADPEIQRLRPDIYAVNEDGDRGGKREYCARHRIEYLVLKRVPAAGLPARSSTELRGF